MNNIERMIQESERMKKELDEMNQRIAENFKETERLKEEAKKADKALMELLDSI